MRRSCGRCGKLHTHRRHHHEERLFISACRCCRLLLLFATTPTHMIGCLAPPAAGPTAPVASPQQQQQNEAPPQQQHDDTATRSDTACGSPTVRRSSSTKHQDDQEMQQQQQQRQEHDDGHARLAQQHAALCDVVRRLEAQACQREALMGGLLAQVGVCVDTQPGTHTLNTELASVAPLRGLTDAWWVACFACCACWNAGASQGRPGSRVQAQRGCSTQAACRGHGRCCSCLGILFTWGRAPVRPHRQA